MANNNIFEFTLLSDYNSPNANLKDNQVFFKAFKKGQTFAGYPLNKNNSNVGTQILSTETIVGKDKWMIPASKLEKKGTKMWATFEDYDKENNSLKVDDLPKEVIQKVNEIAQKNLAKNMGKMVKSSIRLPMILMISGVAAGFLLKKNVYLLGMAGLIGGIFLTSFKSQPIDNATAKV